MQGSTRFGEQHLGKGGGVGGKQQDLEFFPIFSTELLCALAGHLLHCVSFLLFVNENTFHLAGLLRSLIKICKVLWCYINASHFN